MKAKRLIALALTIGALFTASLPVSAVEAPVLSSPDSIIRPMFEYTMYTATSIDIRSGSAYVLAELQGYPSTTQVRIYAYLQQYKNGSWSTITSWNDTFSSNYGIISKSYPVISGYNYRLQASYYAYKGSSSENVTAYSGEYYY